MFLCFVVSALKTSKKFDLKDKKIFILALNLKYVQNRLQLRFLYMIVKGGVAL